MLQPSNTLPNPKFFFGYHVQIWKSTSTFFAGTCQSPDHDVIGEKFLLTKPIKFGLNRKRMLYWSLFSLKPMTDFFLFISYWHSKNMPRDHGIKDEFVYLAKPIVLFTIRKRISCWSILALEPKLIFVRFWNIELQRMSHVTLM